MCCNSLSHGLKVVTLSEIKNIVTKRKPKIVAKTPDRLGILPAVDEEIEPLFEAMANAELGSD